MDWTGLFYTIYSIAMKDIFVAFSVFFSYHCSMLPTPSRTCKLASTMQLLPLLLSAIYITTAIAGLVQFNDYPHSLDRRWKPFYPSTRSWPGGSEPSGPSFDPQQNSQSKSPTLDSQRESAPRQNDIPSDEVLVKGVVYCAKAAEACRSCNPQLCTWPKCDLEGNCITGRCNPEASSVLRFNMSSRRFNSPFEAVSYAWNIQGSEDQRWANSRV